MGRSMTRARRVPPQFPEEGGDRRRRHRRRCVAGQAAHAADPAVTIPAEFAAASSTAPRRLEFPMTGAEVFARACKEEGVAALFCCPGNYNVVHALAATGIPSYGGRHEGSMAHAADAFIRVTGEIAVCSGTEGPGLHRHDLRDRLRQRRPHAAARRREQHVDESGRHRSRYSAWLPAADDRGTEEVRQAADQPAAGARVRGLRVPAAEQRRAEAGAPRFPGRGRGREVQGRRASSSSSTTAAGIAPRRARIPRRRTSPRPST